MENREMVPADVTQEVTQQTRLLDCPTNLDLTTNRGKALAFSAGNPGDIVFDASGTVRICATHWIVIPDCGTNEDTGEYSAFARLILFQSNGRFFRSSSAFAGKRLQAALQLWSPEDWATGIPFVITRRTGLRGHVYHDIRVDYDND